MSAILDKGGPRVSRSPCQLDERDGSGNPDGEAPGLGACMAVPLICGQERGDEGNCSSSYPGSLQHPSGLCVECHGASEHLRLVHCRTWREAGCCDGIHNSGLDLHIAVVRSGFARYLPCSGQFEAELRSHRPLPDHSHYYPPGLVSGEGRGWCARRGICATVARGALAECKLFPRPCSLHRHCRGRPECGFWLQTLGCECELTGNLHFRAGELPGSKGQLCDDCWASRQREEHSIGFFGMLTASSSWPVSREWAQGLRFPETLPSERHGEREYPLRTPTG
mmetsp:Transcript_65572/g.156773  ORF Transcript_65572/g.156773 Transcript_65572/m.156773 type:complete len:281 (+) Transcript_65572:508-1350(+)